MNNKNDLLINKLILITTDKIILINKDRDPLTTNMFWMEQILPRHFLFEIVGTVKFNDNI